MNATKQLSKNRAGLSITDDRPMAIRESCGGVDGHGQIARGRMIGQTAKARPKLLSLM